MTDSFDDVIVRVKRKYAALRSSPKYSVRALPKEMPLAGIYLFSHDGRCLYVGRTNNLKKRLQYHTRNSHNQATFAFLIARRETGNVVASYQASGSREDLLKKPTFRKAFDAAREKIKTMDVQFVEVVEAIDQTILEVYTAMETKAEYNDFDNH